MLRLVAFAWCVGSLDGTSCGPGDYGGCSVSRGGPGTREHVAILLTGLVRTFDIVHPRLREELVLPLERRGAVVDVFVQTSSTSSCGIRDVLNDACTKHAFKGLGREGPPNGSHVVSVQDDAAERERRLADAIGALAAPNLRVLDFSGNATLERFIERMAIDNANNIKDAGDLNSNYEKHKNELYKAHQYWRMDTARAAALAYARADVSVFGDHARPWATHGSLHEGGGLPGDGPFNVAPLEQRSVRSRTSSRERVPRGDQDHESHPIESGPRPV